MKRFAMRRWVKSRDRRGVSIVEFGVVAPVLLIFLFGLIEFARLVMVQQSMTNAARVGCRMCTLATTTTQTRSEDAVRNYLESVIPNSSDPSKVRVTMAPTNFSTMSSGTPITVHVEVTSSDVSWLPGNLLGLVSDPVLSAQATQQRE